MSVFGPHDPPGLQEAIRHAERFCGALSHFEVIGGHWTNDEGRVWLVGRTEEVATVLSCIVEDWREGRVGAARATASAQEYLEDLHVAARKEFGLEAVLDCCFGDARATIATRSTCRDGKCPVILRPMAARDTLANPQALWVWTRAYRG